VSLFAVPDDANFMLCSWTFSKTHRLKTIDIIIFCYWHFRLTFSWGICRLLGVIWIILYNIIFLRARARVCVCVTICLYLKYTELYTTKLILIKLIDISFPSYRTCLKTNNVDIMVEQSRFYYFYFWFYFWIYFFIFFNFLNLTRF